MGSNPFAGVRTFSEKAVRPPGASYLKYRAPDSGKAYLACLGALMKNYKQWLENRIEGLKQSKIVPERDKKLILKFHDICLSEGVGMCRIDKYIRILMWIRETLGKDFKKAGKDDIRKVVAEIEKSNYAEWTKHDYKVTIKKFWK